MEAPTEKPIAEDSHPFAGRKYIRAVGRRKSASAVAQLYAKGSGKFFINRRPLAEYFSYFTDVDRAKLPLGITGAGDAFDVDIKVAGGGRRTQADAAALAVARALIKHDDALKPTLRKNGLLTVDRRVKERKKPGLKRARRAPQWSKR